MLAYQDAVPDLAEIYLEDSYILAVDLDSSKLSMDMEFVLREGHPLWRPPNPDEHYCYQRGKLVFKQVHDMTPERIDWHCVPARDASGEIDYGNVDAMKVDLPVVCLEAGFGKIQFRCTAIQVAMDTPE